MLFSNIQEISHIIPTSKFKSLDNLISRLNAEEMSSLYPLVGKPLLDKLRADYGILSQLEGGIWADPSVAHFAVQQQPSSESDASTAEVETKLTILRTCQEILLYSFLSNHSAILQASFNMGGGWNKASTNDYDTLDPKDNDRLDKDLWHSARRSKENLLLYLEMDARDQQVYTDLWKESEYFYLHSDLLFTTSSELHPLYINLGDAPHLNFQAYISTLHDCQDGYLAGTLGYTLLQALIDRKYEQSATPSSPQESSPAGSTDNEISPAEKAKLWRTLDRHIRTSLANFTAYEQAGAKHDHIKNRGQSQLSIATRFIHDHYAVFAPYIDESAPIYIPPAPDPSVAGGSTAVHSHHCPPPPHPHRGTVFSLLH